MLKKFFKTFLFAVVISTCSFSLGQILDEIVIEAEDYNVMSGIAVEDTSDVGGGQNIGWIDQGDFVEYTLQVPSTGEYLIEYRVAGFWCSLGFENRIGGVLVDTQALDSPTGWQFWNTQQSIIPLFAGEQTMRFDFIDGPININWIRLTRIDPEDSSSFENPNNLYPGTYNCNDQNDINDNQNNEDTYDDGLPIIYEPQGVIEDLNLSDIDVRGRPYIDNSLGYNLIRSDMGTLLRGVSLSTDGGDPYNALNLLDKSDIKLESLQSMVSDYGFNTLHVYLEGDAEQNPDPVGINEELADHLVNITREAKMYLIITIGNNGENGAIHSMDKVLAFWDLYGAKYKDETHVIYEAHNEPVSGINAYWTAEDWDKQAQMYEKIRQVAPDTMVLLGSFMSFFGGSQAINGANDLADEFPGIWDNAGFAFHAYWDIGQIESTIEAFKTSDDYPALLCTEFWPGDTKNGFNEVFESHQIGWTQFEWLGGNDLELDRVKNYLDTYGTAWRPDNPDSTWPASGTPNIPVDQKVGLYSRVDKAFLGLDNQNRVVAGDHSYDGIGFDEFTVVDAGNDGYIALLADNGRFLSVSNYDSVFFSNDIQPLVASAGNIGVREKFKWLELPTGDIALRPLSTPGKLIGTMPNDGWDNFGLIGSIGEGIKRGGANTFKVVTSYADSVDPLPEIPPVPPGPFFGSPMPVPTNGDHDLPTTAPDDRLYASDYDIGGEGISYHDTGAINLGEAYRPSEGVDVESSNEGHTAVGFFEAEEWLQFTVDVAQAGNYTVTFRTASSGGGFISLESDCQKLTDNLATPDTGWWDLWQDMTVDVTLKAGVQKLRVVSGGNMSLMNMDIQPGGEGGADYGAGCEWQPPEPDDLKVEAEDWTTVIAAPAGTVNIDTASDNGLSQYVGNFDAGDFIEYAVELPQTSCYRAEYRVASDPGSDGFEIKFGGQTVDSFQIYPTGGWSSWVTFTRYYELNAGSQTLRLEALGDSFNVNWLRFNATDAVDCELSDTIVIEAEAYASVIEQPDGEVGTQPTNDEGGGLNVGWIDAGDWMEYEINVIEAGNYSVSYRMASQGGSSSGVNLLLDGNLVDSTLVPNTGGWQLWQTADGGNISLEAGDYVLRFEAPGGGLNLNWIKLMPTDETATGNIGTGVDDSIVTTPITLTQEILTGEWKLAPVAGSAGVGWESGNMGWWQIDAGAVINRACLFDDLFIFAQDGSFINQMGGSTWVEPWQGATAEGCDTPVAPHDGAGRFSYMFDESAMTITLTGVGAYIGMAKVISGGDELTNPDQAPESIVYKVIESTENSMTLEVAYTDGFWTFKLVTSDYVAPVNEEPSEDLPPNPIDLTQEILTGEWKLAPEAGSAGVGWESGNMGWWQIDAGAVINRACLFDDLFIFAQDGSFINQMGGTTWLEPWQGTDPEACGTPVAPHDGSANTSYALDTDAGTITLNGVGAYIGMAKVISGGNELTSPDDAPESIVYKVMESTENTMTLEVAYSGGFWTFKLVKESDLPDAPLPASEVTVPELEAGTQHVYVSEKTLSEDGGQVTVKLSYLVDDPTLTGVGFYLNFDSSVLSLGSVTDVASGAVASGALNDDGDGLIFAWSDPFGGSWPGSTEADLATVTFNILEGATDPTVLDMVEISTPPGYEFDGQSHNLAISPRESWDFDQSGNADALTDGLLLLRYAFGLRGDTLIAEAVAQSSTMTSQEIENAIQNSSQITDIDADGSVDALTDGLLLLRYLFGLRDSNLVAGVVSESATRSSEATIMQHIENHMP